LILEEDFVRQHTVLGPPSACPEISLYLATEVTPLWQATEASLTAHNLPPPYWAFAWPGGQALARLLLDSPEVVRGKRVLDFAAGSGLVAIAAAKAGAASVEAAEIDSFAIAAIRLNAAANEAEIEVRLEDVTQMSDAPWDVVFAGDVCYERPMAEKVFAWLSRLQAMGVEILMADPGRAYLPAGEALIEVARFEIPTSLELEDRLTRTTIIYRLRSPI
jgi:predicted nicotinamide N-methyase